MPQRSPRSGDRLVQPLDFEYLKLSTTISYYNAAHQDSRAYVKFRIQKDQCIWFSVLVPWGIEVMRGMITPTGITLLNHMQKIHYVYDYATLRSLWPGPWDYALVQALLLGELAQAYTAQEVVQEGAQQAVIQQQKGAWTLNHLVNPALGKVEKLVATASQGSIVAAYNQFKPYQGGLLVGQATLNWYDYTAATAPAMTVTLAGIKAQWSKKPLEFPLAIPAHYEKR